MNTYTPFHDCSFSLHTNVYCTCPCVQTAQRHLVRSTPNKRLTRVNAGGESHPYSVALTKSMRRLRIRWTLVQLSHASHDHAEARVNPGADSVRVVMIGKSLNSKRFLERRS